MTEFAFWFPRFVYLRASWFILPLIFTARIRSRLWWTSHAGMSEVFPADKSNQAPQKSPGWNHAHTSGFINIIGLIVKSNQKRGLYT